METASFLATKVGPRPAGSREEAAARGFLLRLLTDLGETVDSQPFTFRGWRSEGPATLEVLSTDAGNIVGMPLRYTDSTSAGGAVGILRWEGVWPVIHGRLACPRFTVRDSGGRTLAAVVAVPVGSARPIPNTQPLFCLPTIVIGADDGAHLRKLADSGRAPIKVRVVCPSIWEGPLDSANLVARTRDPLQNGLLVVAHYDSVEGSPGANDNASGVALLARLVERSRSKDFLPFGFRFAFFGAEEPFLVGSRAYAANLATSGELREIRACLSLDMVAVGDRFAIRSDAHNIWGRAGSAISVSSAGRSVSVSEAMPTSDQWAFQEVGVVAAQLTREPDPAWHSADDEIARFSGADLDDAESVAVELLLRVAEELIGGRPSAASPVSYGG